MVSHPEPDILDYEVKWALGSTAVNKASGCDGIPVQFSSIAQSCLTLCDPTDCSLPGFPVHHQLLELAQTYVHRVDDVYSLKYKHQHRKDILSVQFSSVT